MPRKTKNLTKENKWTLVLVAGLIIIYGIFHWQDWYHKPKPNISETQKTAILKDSSDTLRISSLEVEAPIVYSDEVSENGIQLDLQGGVVHLASTAMPGEAGNVYIVGHSSNFKNAPGSFNTIFATLPNIKVGDEIIIDHNQKQYTYVVYETRIVLPTELWVMSQETDNQKLLTLQTSYPVGTADKRFIAIAKLKE
jgi:sortase A